MTTKSGKHANKIVENALSSAAKNGAAKAVDMRKVAALSAGAAGVIAGAAIAFGATPAMAAEATSTPVKTTEPAKEQELTANKKKAEAKDEAAAEGAKKTETDASKKDEASEKTDGEVKANENKTKLAGEGAAKADANAAEVVDQQAESGKAPAGSTTGDAKGSASADANKQGAVRENGGAAKRRGKRALPDAQPTDEAAGGEDRSVSTGENRAATPAPAPKVNSEITLSQDKKDTLPNMYAWGSSDNVYIEKGQNQEVKFILKPADGVSVTKVAIFPSDTNGIESTSSRVFLEYYSDDTNAHQSYSGTYDFKANNDGSATLTMSKLYREGRINGAQGYAANRCIYVYGTKDGKTVLLYKTNVARAATLIPPKNAGSIVLKYNEELTEKQIQDKLKAALGAPTEATGKKSVSQQIVAASTASKVGARTGANGAFVQTPDNPEKKIVITDNKAYDTKQVETINTVTSAPGDAVTSYKTGAQTLDTHLISDLGYKSDVLPLTVARYDTRIDKPIVEDPTNVSAEVKEDIKKKLARLNNVSLDQVTINDQGEFTINFAGVDPKDAPKIALRDLVLKKLEEKDISVPAADKAVFVANPLGYSSAELDRIKTAIFDANKDNQELGLTSKDQITLSYITGDTTGAGKANQGISNGQAENKITVKIKTDKAVAEFTSNVKENKLTKLPNIRTDYNVSWEKDKNKLDGRDSDEGLSWSNDKHTTIIYRYDPTAAKELKTDDIIKLLKATPKDQQAGLRDLTGGETLDHEGSGNNPRKSHMHYALQNGEPTGELSLGNMDGAYWYGDQKVSNSNVNLGDEEAKVGQYSWDSEAGSVTVAAKQNKVFKARLFVQPYAMTYYKDVYLESGRNPGNTAKAINVIFVPQTNHKTKDLNKSIGEHKTVAVEGKDVPTQSAYYNASDKVKKDYEDALKVAKQTLEKVGTTPDDQLSEQLKAEVDNATIKLDKARKALDGAKTDKEKLKGSINENGKAAEGQTAATGTQATDRYKNVTNPDFKTADGKPDDAKNNAAKEAKKAYDEALAEANKVNSDDNATQKAVDDAKAKLDAARAKLNDFTTSKDKLNAAIAEHGQVNTGDAKLTDPNKKLASADPTYQNSTPEQRKAYDDAVKKANELAKDPNASQKDVNAAIDALQKAKEALDAKATNKSQLEARLLTSLDHVGDADDQKSVFYKNGKDPNYFADTNTKFPKGVDKEKAKKYADEYDDALAKAKALLKDPTATQKQVDEALAKLKEAEDNLHKLQSDANDLVKTLADNFTGYLLPAYFNAFDKAQAEGKDSQAAKDFKAYNDAYHAAKKLQTKFKDADPAKRPTQKEINDAQTMLEEARKVIDTYATDTSKLSVAILNDVAIQKSPAYNNAKALADKQNPAPEEQAQVEAAKKAVEAYQAAMEKINKAFKNQMEKDQKDGQEIPADKAPDADGDTSSPNYLDGIQSHAKKQPLNKDVTDALADFNKAREGLNAFATKTDELIKSINEDATTHPSPAFKNASHPDYKNESGQADTDKNGKASKAVDDYGAALNKAKELLKKPDATQKEVNDALKKLDDARKELDKYNTDTTKLAESVKKHGSTEGPAATEGTQTSDAYRNASDPHFLTADGKPDTDKNAKAAADKKAYDEALTKAQELLKKHDDKATPQDAKPTQKEIDAALKALDDARKKLEDNYKTVTTDLEKEINKSTPETAPAATGDDFENTPEFKNADAKKKDGADGNKVDNDDVKAYKDALAKARKLAQDNTSKTLSDRPTQKQINDALEALKKAKQAITDGYKTDTSKLEEAKKYAEDVFKKTPEYKNATAVKNDNNNAKHEQAGKDLGDATKQTGFEGQIAKIAEKLKDTSKLTQREVDALVKQLNIAQKKIADDYKTNVTPLSNEVGDKDEKGNPVIPPFEASVAYKNALEKAKTEDTATTDPNSATVKLKAYADKLQAAQELINKVNNPDPNVEADKQPTNADVKKALDELQKAKKDIDDAFKTKADALKKETKELNDNGQAKEDKDKFENSTEFKNASAKKGADGKDIEDVQTYKAALEKANKLLGKFDENGNPNPGEKDIPTQQEVDEAQKALKEIKDKILANYKSSSTPLQMEADNSDLVFENTPAFKNADAAKDGSDDNADMKAYKEALKKAKGMLEKFDRTTGKPKAGLTAGTKVPTQQELDKALKALQEAKKKIEDDYSTKKGDLRTEAGADDTFRQTPEFQNAVGSKEAEEYENALAEANSVLGDKNATQADVDAALKRLQEAKAALRGKHGTDKSDLRNEAENDPTFRDSIPFLIANSADIAEYNKALNEANAVLADPNATQAEVDAALRKLRLAKQKIMDFYNSLGSFGNGGSGYVGTGFGVGAAAVDKSMLIVEVNGALADIANGVNANASANAANAAAVISEFNAALQNARAVLANPNATQAQVDAALSRLRAARAALAALNAADADRGGSSRGSLSVQTGVDSATLSAFAAMFVGLAGLGVSAKRRKHASR